ncbi:MAG TPA: hypothetical protein VH914_05290 [Acidimicrobiia bacterium]|nr:hypothetical protein [Acidimicrobiia bacterium]
MSSIWTPSGEYEPHGEDDGPPAGGDISSDPALAEGPEISDEELDALRRVHEQLRATPAIDVVANHVVQLFQLALVYLGAGGASTGGEEPFADLVQASVVIDTMAAIVDGLGARLAEHEQTLRDALSQLQMLWVEIADQS